MMKEKTNTSLISITNQCSNVPLLTQIYDRFVSRNKFGGKPNFRYRSTPSINCRAKTRLGKKGLSPVIATVLLVGIVIVMALIVFMWVKGINEEAITKFDGQNVKIVCEDVSFEASLSGGNILIANRGNVPIYKMKAKISGAGSYDTINIEDQWKPEGLLKGDAVKSDISADISGQETILLIPVLAGESNEGTRTYTCEERFGYEITI